MNEMRRRITLVLIAITLAFASFLSTSDPNRVQANTELQNKMKNIQGEQRQNQAEVKDKEAEVKEIENRINKVHDEIRVIDHQTASTNQQIRNKDAEIEATKERIAELVAEIEALEERISERDELLNNRVRSMYKNGGSVNYLEVILGARSFGDLVNRITALSTIAQQDRAILEAHHNDKMAVEEVKLLMEQELTMLEQQMADLEALKITLESQRKEKDRLMANLQQQEGQLHAELGELEETAEMLAIQEKAIQQELEAWKERERQRKLEEERRRQEAARSGNTVHPTPVVTPNGQLMRPTTGNVTSPYGMRWGQMHHGVDIGKGGRSGDVHVVAAEAGTVIRSEYNVSYGNVVTITHNIDGRVLTTLYAHLENRFVSVGQRVEKGQLLGYMGNTGHSFGAHLHFEVHEGPWVGSRANSRDPLLYIPR